MGRDRVKKGRDKHAKKSKRKDKRKDKKSRNRRRSRTPSYSYSYTYSYSEDSRSPTPRNGRRGGRGGGRDRSRSRRGRCAHSPPRRNDSQRGGKGGGFIPTSGPRSPSRDGSPPNDWIYNMLIDREKARVKRDFVEADKLREELQSRGVEILERERRWTHRDGRSGARPNADDKKRDE